MLIAVRCYLILTWLLNDLLTVIENFVRGGEAPRQFFLKLADTCEN